jgi:AcrR family transcriptional regulator
MTETITDRQFEIIQVAGKILTESGVSGLTIKNLAKEMGFSEAAIYRHFASKEKIVIGLLAYLANNMDERYTTALDNNLNSEEKFIILFQNQFSFFHKNPHFVGAVFYDGLMEVSEQINLNILKIMKMKMKHLKPILLEGQKTNVFTNAIPVEDLAHIVMGTMRLQMFKWRGANFQFDIQQKGDDIIQSLLTLIKK